MRLAFVLFVALLGCRDKTPSAASKPGAPSGTATAPAATGATGTPGGPMAAGESQTAGSDVTGDGGVPKEPRTKLQGSEMAKRKAEFKEKREQEQQQSEQLQSEPDRTSVKTPMPKSP